MALFSKKVAVAVTGGIAAYKACEVVRELKRQGAEVRVAMTDAAREFVSELTFATLSENPVLSTLFGPVENKGTLHLDLGRWCDLLLICPATANFIGKMASGIADDAVSTTVLATRSPVLICPAMNSAMWENAIVQENIATLRRHGYDFVEPEWGELATRSEGAGWGRLAAPERILQQVQHRLLASDELSGKKVLVTAGPTREPLDPVRFLSNYSSGKMGFALAEVAALMGAQVTLIAGPNNLTAPPAVKYVTIETAEELRKAVLAGYKEADILVMAAAVADYTPKKISGEKIKKSDAALRLDLKKTPDILAELGENKRDCLHIGFALETENGEANAIAKLRRKKLDLIVLNKALQPDVAFGGDMNVVTLINKDEEIEKLPRMSKVEVARIVLQRAAKLLHSAANPKLEAV